MSLCLHLSNFVLTVVYFSSALAHLDMETLFQAVEASLWLMHRCEMMLTRKMRKKLAWFRRLPGL